MFLIQIEKQNLELLDEIIKQPDIETTIVSKKNFNGQTELVELLCTATLTSIPFIYKIIIAGINSRKNILIKYNGITINGLSQENAYKVLEKLIEKK